MFRKNVRPEPPFVSAVIVAAGMASRMEGIDKQQVPIDDIPVVVRSVMRVSESPRISEIILVCREANIPEYYDLIREYGLDKVSTVVAGGQTRQDSVFRGIACCSSATDFYAIHDGARPLVDVYVIEQCIDAAFAYGAAAAGVKLKDTIKYCDEQAKILSTPDRNRLYAIQTPQIFRADLYQQAMQTAIREGRNYTDDCQLVERLGKEVYVSPGSYANIKITTPEDLALASAILAYRDEEVASWQSFE